MRKAYLNGCGRLNTRTGKNLHFNLLDAAIDWSSATLTLVQPTTWSGDTKGQKVIGGFGRLAEIGERIEMQTAGHRFLGMATVLATFPCTPEGLAALRARVGGTIAFATLD